MPTEIDVVERRIRQLEIERVALAKETDDASKERLTALDDELAELKAQVDEMKAHWEAEKEAIGAIRTLKEELEALNSRARAGARPRAGGRDPLRARSPSSSAASPTPPTTSTSCSRSAAC